MGKRGEREELGFAVLQFTEYYTVYQDVPPISSPGFLIGHNPRLSGVLLVIFLFFSYYRLSALNFHYSPLVPCFYLHFGCRPVRG